MDLKFHPIHYKPPIKDDMAVVLVFFNPQRSIRIVQNIITVIHYLKTANIPYFIHELAFNDEPHIFAPAPNVKLSRSTSYMFYKENLIHTLLPSIPEKYTKICIMDADIMFDEPFWYTIISTTLDIYDICQPFTTAYFLGANFKPIKERTNCIDASASKIDWTREHTGHIWAFKRDWYENSGLIDTTIVGGGDFMMTIAIRGCEYQKDPTSLLYKDFLPNINYSHIGRSSCNLTIYHLFHGLEVNRQYSSRISSISDVLRLHNLQLKDIIKRRSDGILEWIPEKKDIMNEFMTSYFGRRNDDLVAPDFIGGNKLYILKPYNYPHIQDMVVILPFFNPVQNIRIIQNILTVKYWLEKAHIPFYIGEVANGKQPFLFKEAFNIIQFRTDSIMFHKENLIDILETRLPKVYTKICILDADILFSNCNWYTITSTLLDTCDICQPFNKATWLHADYTEHITRTNCLDSSSNTLNWNKEHPGFVWAFNREWYRNFHYRNMIICMTGADTILHDFVKKRHSSSSYLSYKKDYDIVESLNLNIQYATTDLHIYHLNHGVLQKRLYVEYKKGLEEILADCSISSPSEAAYRRVDGLLEWKEACKDKINEYNIKYFIGRSEDDVE